MAEFSYIIRTDKGSRETGNISAENYNDALEKLQKDGTAVIKLIERDSSFDFIKPFVIGSHPKYGITLYSNWRNFIRR